MRKFIIDMTMSYDFKVTIEAESEEEAERIVSAKVKELMYGGPYYTITDSDEE